MMRRVLSWLISRMPGPSLKMAQSGLQPYPPEGTVNPFVEQRHRSELIRRDLEENAEEMAAACRPLWETMGRGLKAAEAANGFALAIATYWPSANPIRQRARRNALLWERLRGIAWEGWTA